MQDHACIASRSAANRLFETPTNINPLSAQAWQGRGWPDSEPRSHQAWEAGGWSDQHGRPAPMLAD